MLIIPFPHFVQLTDHVQVNVEAQVLSRRDLALVDARVPVLGIFYLKGPVFCLLMMNRSKALITRVRVMTNREQMRVSVT